MHSKNTRKPIKTVVCILLAAVLLCCSSCSAKPAMKAGKVKLSESMYAYFMSCYRPYWINLYSNGDTEEFWNGEVNGVTVKEYLQDVTLTAIKSKLAAAYLFEEYGLKVTDAKKKEVEALIDGMVLGVGEESVFEQDSLMVQLGVDRSVMTEIFLLNAKSEMLEDYLYGESGIDVVNSGDRTAYYNENYVRYKHLYIMDVDYVLDENGKLQYDENGYAVWEEISDERWEEKFELAKQLKERAEKGEDFDKLIDEYTEELGHESYPYGHYICTASVNESDYFPDILTNVKSTSIGSFMLFRSDYGLHLIQRLELDEGAYERDENESDFSDFEELVRENKYKKRLAQCFDEIEINEEIIEKYQINTVAYSNTWTYVF